MTFSTDFFKTALYGFRGTIWKKPNFSEKSFLLNFSRFYRSSFDLWRKVLGPVAAMFLLILKKMPSRYPEENCGFWELFSKEEQASAKRWRKWQTKGRKGHLLRRCFSFNHSKWQKLKRQLPSNSNFWKDAFQKKQCNIVLDNPFAVSILFFFQKIESS